MGGDSLSKKKRTETLTEENHILNWFKCVTLSACDFVRCKQLADQQGTEISTTSSFEAWPHAALFKQITFFLLKLTSDQYWCFLLNLLEKNLETFQFGSITCLSIVSALYLFKIFSLVFVSIFYLLLMCICILCVSAFPSWDLSVNCGQESG